MTKIQFSTPSLATSSALLKDPEELAFLACGSAFVPVGWKRSQKKTRYEKFTLKSIENVTWSIKNNLVKTAEDRDRP